MPTKFGRNLSPHSWVILWTNKQTDKRRWSQYILTEARR